MTEKRFENRLYTNLKSGSLNPVYDNEKEDGLNIFKIVDLLNEFDSENKKLERENLDLSEELDYYKTKCASLETGYIKAEDENWKLEKSNMELANELGKTIDENEKLKSENKRLTDKLNKTALELVDGCISQGKATEISEMSYREFLDYRAKNGKPMELKK